MRTLGATLPTGAAPISPGGAGLHVRNMDQEHSSPNGESLPLIQSTSPHSFRLSS